MRGPAQSRSLGRTLCGLALVGVTASCSTAPGNAETDRIAAVVTRAISFPHQDSADGFVRAALATQAGQDARLTVVEVDERHAGKREDPLAHLVFRVRVEAGRSGFSSGDPIVACYGAEFSYYGLIGNPRRIDCPRGAGAIVPPPTAPPQRAVIPAGFDTTLGELLAGLPAAPSSDDVRATVTGRLPAAEVDPNTGQPNLLATVEIAVRGDDVGVSLWALDGRHCLLGARISGHVTVGRPTRGQMQPGELSCDPQTALQLPSIRPPH